MSELSSNNTPRTYLLERDPEYIDNVPHHWLEQSLPAFNVQVIVATMFLLICIPGNIGQILVFVAHRR